MKTPGKRAAQRTDRERKLTPEQQAAREAFAGWWVGTAYPARHGVEYEFDKDGGRNGKAVLLILGSKNVSWDLDLAKAVATAFLNERDAFLTNRSHKLWDLAERLERFVKLAHAAGGKVNGHGSKNGQPAPAGGRGAVARDGEFSQRITARNVL